LANFCNPEIPGLRHCQSRDSGLAKMAGIPGFGILGLQSLLWMFYVTFCCQQSAAGLNGADTDALQCPIRLTTYGRRVLQWLIAWSHSRTHGRYLCNNFMWPS